MNYFAKKLRNPILIGKTQRYFKTRTMEHVQDVWKVMKSGSAKFGENWYGSGGYSGADVFAI